MYRIVISSIVLIVLSLSANNVLAKWPPDGDGVPGRVLKVANGYFIFECNYGQFQVFVSKNTHFQLDGKPSTPDQVKEGLTMRVAAHITSNHVWECYKANVVAIQEIK